MLIEEKALRHWIDNFYGYGSWQARFWFIGFLARLTLITRLLEDISFGQRYQSLQQDHLTTMGSNGLNDFCSDSVYSSE